MKRPTVKTLSQRRRWEPCRWWLWLPMVGVGYWVFSMSWVLEERVWSMTLSLPRGYSCLCGCRRGMEGEEGSGVGRGSSQMPWIKSTSAISMPDKNSTTSHRPHRIQ
ncbi:hypothetical protein I7I53_08024 [Histoplasma capsulatum var. duboisii H88]|uniref:Uncharacterized protein n=1 Tax=Ajellomyces capsulatus (strain H88) TaxID=544711 RepID=A0A8A1LEW6_AJEC8|nr:hypothetical protein I7I53_08024 [Histoplasma capsulatum var. duboisii H88]